MDDNEPRIIRLGPVSSSLEADVWSPGISPEKSEFEDLVFLPKRNEFQPNQESDIEIDNDGLMMITVNQSLSTPGVRLVESIILEEGEYELEILGYASVEGTFFPWIVEAKTSLRLAPLSHMTTIDEATSVPFFISERTEIIVGVIAHGQEIGDQCFIRSLTVASTKPKAPKSKGSFKSFTPEEFEPHQRTDLSIKRGLLHVRSENYSTPGALSYLEVTPGAIISVKVKAELNPRCVAFVYISSENGRELTKRNIVLGRGGSEKPVLSEEYGFVRIPWDVTKIKIGLLFSSVSSAEVYGMTIEKLEVVEVKILNEVVDETYVLSLGNEEEKFDICSREARRHGISLNRWIAVNGYSDENMENWNNYMEKPWTDLDMRLGRKAIDKPGAWGYMLTMEEIFKDAMKKKFQSVAVFDDDFVLSKTFTHDFSKLLEQIGPNWDVIYLGASQWAWDGIDTEAVEGFYHPTKNTNGTFGVIYRSTIYEDLLYEIRKMEAPFDSGPLGELVSTKFQNTSYVAYPNIVIANVEKEGIRDSRNQKEYSKRFQWRLENFPRWFTNWSLDPKIIRNEWLEDFTSDDVDRFLGVTTYNRLGYLKGFIRSFENTRSLEHNWCLIIADDGSEDGTIEWLLNEYQPSGISIVILQNDSTGIARQSNSIISYFRESGQKSQVLYMCNDDIRFERRGWDDLYYDSMNCSGFDHLVYFNPDWKNPLQDEFLDLQFPLRSYTDSLNVMGCLFTLTHRLVEKIGFFDEESFPVRGHSHIDFTVRACRMGANQIDMTFDAEESNDFVIMETKEDYIRTSKILGIWENEQINDPSILKIRESLLIDDTRTFIQRKW